jgi:hypothetical protein
VSYNVANISSAFDRAVIQCLKQISQIELSLRLLELAALAAGDTTITAP